MKRTEPVLKALKDTPGLLKDKYSAAELISMSTSIIASDHQPDPSEVGLFDTPNKARQRSYELLNKEFTSFEIGDNSTALYHIAVLVDPLSEQGQKWSSIIQVCTSVFPILFVCW
jgi:UDP-glucose:glycoprotein glucosyltransferase